MALKNVSNIIQENEDWLIHRILHYAKLHDYTRYTSTLAEAWRMSISGLTESLVKGLDHYEDVPEMGPDDDFQRDPLTHFGIVEAKRHRNRGVTLSMFLGLIKYYRQCYVDLIQEHQDTIPDHQHARLFIERAFDRMEIAFCQEWSGTDREDQVAALQSANRLMTNEKNAYLTVFESLSDPAIILDKEEKIIDLNHAAMSLVDAESVPGAMYYRPGGNRFFSNRWWEDEPGIMGNSILGQPLKSLFPWLSTIVHTCSETKCRNCVQECETVIDGTQRHFEVKFAQMLDISEKFDATILSLREITKRTIIKKALSESEERFRALFEASIEGIAIHELVYSQGLDPVDYRIIDVNPAYTRHTGIRREDAVGKTGRQLYQSEQSPYLGIFTATALTGVPDFFESYFEPMDKHFRISVFCPKHRMFVTVFEDISVTKQAEKNLRESETRYKSLFHNNHSVMLLIDPETGCLIDANPAAEAYYQYDRGTLLSMTIFEINALSPEEVAFEIQQAREEKRSYFNFQHRLGSGEIRDVEVFTGPIIVETKQLLYSIIHDVTDRKKMEEALKKSNQELDDFAYIASHDLREPLRGISNYATFLLEDYGTTIDADGKSKLETLKRLCKREEDLIQSLLDYSRLGRTDLRYEPVDLNILIAEAGEMLESSYPGQDIRISIPHRLPTIQGDAVRIREIFFNLMSNAVKYNDNQEKLIEIGCQKRDGDDGLPGKIAKRDSVCVHYVRDNGIGIPEKHQDKVFTIFKRLHGRDKYGGGTGAGLTIVKKIVERHGGTIWLDATVGKGTTFYFTLPGSTV